MAEFASRWPRVRRWALDLIRPEVDAARTSAERDESLSSQVVVSVTPGQIETPVSRQYLVTVDAWDYRAPTTAKDDAHELCADAAFIIESAVRDSNPVIRTELNAGPTEHRDEAGYYFYSATVLVVIHRLP